MLIHGFCKCISLTWNWNCTKQVGIIETGPKMKKIVFYWMSRHGESRGKGRIPAEVWI